MKYVAVICLMLLSFSRTNAQETLPEEQHPSQTWHLGQLTLNDGLSIKGLIKYDLKSEAIHLDVEGAIRTFIANQIAHLSFFQADIKRERKFVVASFEEKGGFKRPKLFEVIYENETGLLAREEHIFSNWTKSDPSGVKGLRPSRYYRYGMRRGAFKKISYDYFLVDQEGNVKTVPKGAKSVARSFDDHYKMLRSYIKSNKLKIKEVDGMVKLVTFYNTLD